MRCRPGVLARLPVYYEQTPAAEQPLKYAQTAVAGPCLESSRPGYAIEIPIAQLRALITLPDMVAQFSAGARRTRREINVDDRSSAAWFSDRTQRTREGSIPQSLSMANATRRALWVARHYLNGSHGHTSVCLPSAAHAFLRVSVCACAFFCFSLFRSRSAGASFKRSQVQRESAEPRAYPDPISRCFNSSPLTGPGL